MAWNEIVTLVLSIISVLFTAGIGVATIIINVRISKINNIKEYKENNKHITPFELQFRDEEWLYDIIITKDEFYKYDESSQKRITKWFQKYAATHKLKKFKVINVDVKEEEKVEVKATVEETTKKPKTSAKTTTQVILPNFRGGKVKMVNVEIPEAIIEARRQGNLGKATLHEYPIEDSTITPTQIITDLIDEFDEEDDKK